MVLNLRVLDLVLNLRLDQILDPVLVLMSVSQVWCVKAN